MNWLGLFSSEARQALDTFAPVFAQLLGRGAPVRNYAALVKWARKWFGPDDPLSLTLDRANKDWIRSTYQLYCMSRITSR